MSAEWSRQLKAVARRGMEAVAPEFAVAVMSARARAHSHRLVREWGLTELNKKLVERLGPRVLRSPFRGMTLTPMTFREHLGPFLLGTYEAELHPWFEWVISRHFDQVLDIGSKFGYYAVGLAIQMPMSAIVAFDTDHWARRATREMAAANHTSNVQVEGFCSPRWVDRHLRANCLIVSDCEGYEGELLLRASTTALESATVLVEIHDQLVPGVGAAIRDRFRATHTIQSVLSAPQHPLDLDLSFLSREEAVAATREIRGPQEWLLMTPQQTRDLANRDS